MAPAVHGVREGLTLERRQGQQGNSMVVSGMVISTSLSCSSLTCKMPAWLAAPPSVGRCPGCQPSRVAEMMTSSPFSQRTGQTT